MSLFDRLRNFIWQTLILLPLSALVSASSCASIVGIVGGIVDIVRGTSSVETYIFMTLGVVCMVLWFFINRLYYIAREMMDDLRIDLLVSPVRVVFQAISVVLALLAIFIPVIKSEYWMAELTITGNLFCIEGGGYIGSEFSAMENVHLGNIFNFFKTLIIFLPVAFIDSYWFIEIFRSSLTGTEYFAFQFWFMDFTDAPSIGLFVYVFVWLFSHTLYLTLKGHHYRASYIGSIKYVISVGEHQRTFIEDVLYISLYGLFCAAMSCLSVVITIVSAIMALIFPATEADAIFAGNDYYYSWRLGFEYEAACDYPLRYALLHYFTGIVYRYD